MNNLEIRDKKKKNSFWSDFFRSRRNNRMVAKMLGAFAKALLLFFWALVGVLAFDALKAPADHFFLATADYMDVFFGKKASKSVIRLAVCWLRLILANFLGKKGVYFVATTTNDRVAKAKYRGSYKSLFAQLAVLMGCFFGLVLIGR